MSAPRATKADLLAEIERLRQQQTRLETRIAELEAAVKAQIEQTIAAADSALGELHAIAKGRRRARKG